MKKESNTMDVYEITLTIAWIIIAFILIWFVEYFKDKTKKLEDEIERLYKLNGRNDDNIRWNNITWNLKNN
jgi:hypothetical protein